MVLSLRWTAAAAVPALVALGSRTSLALGMRTSSSPMISSSTTKSPLLPTTRHVVSVFLQKSATGSVLVLKRSDKVSSYKGAWAAVSGSIEEGEDVLGAGLREVEEETGIPPSSLKFEVTGRPLSVLGEGGDKLWVVHPILLSVIADEEVRLDWEHTECRWASRDDIASLDSVPRLMDALEAVQLPEAAVEGLNFLIADRSHGASELTCEAMSILRRTAEELVGNGQMEAMERRLLDVGWQLLRSRPSMRSSLAHGVQLFMTRLKEVKGEWSTVDPHLSQVHVEEAFALAMEDQETAIRRLGAKGAQELERRGCRRLLTHSLSSSVRAVLRNFMELSEGRGPLHVVFTESRPLMEGVHQLAKVRSDARRLGVELHTTLITDAQAGVFLSQGCDALLLGCDGINPSGGAVNKAGSLLLALAAKQCKIPVLIATEVAKSQVASLPNENPGVEANTAIEYEEAEASELLAALPGDVELEGTHVRNVYFEEVPAELIDAYLTEFGVLDLKDMKTTTAQRNEILQGIFCN
jgi:translation initiation factor 2B subunit (eIF-2B alpha/beta/delta family)/8-oxo-dGTP pyrophosphatase MutT (NUDIX family)